MGTATEANLPSDSSPVGALTQPRLEPAMVLEPCCGRVRNQLDPELWHATQNPWVILQTASPEKLNRVAADPAFRQKLQALIQRKRRGEQTAGWFQRTHTAPQFTAAAYFSLEFMLSNALPIYSEGTRKRHSAGSFAARAQAWPLLPRQGRSTLPTGIIEEFPELG